MKNLITLFLFLFCVQSYAKTIKVAIIDTGFSTVAKHDIKFCKESYDFTGYGFKDEIGHGTNIAGLVAEKNDDIDYCIIVIKFMHNKSALNISYYFKALEKVAELKPDILNLSLGGYGHFNFEDQYIKKILDNGTIIAAAAGNESTNLNNGCIFYPACIDSRIYVIGNKSYQSNYGRVVDKVIDGQNKTALGFTASGTSQSTAIFTGQLIRKLHEQRKNKN